MYEVIYHADGENTFVSGPRCGSLKSALAAAGSAKGWTINNAPINSAVVVSAETGEVFAEITLFQ